MGTLGGTDVLDVDPAGPPRRGPAAPALERGARRACCSGPRSSPTSGSLAAVVVIVAFFASIVGHEAAHAYVARHYGIATTSIDLWALGGMARLEREPRTPRAEGWIAAAGPLASLAIGVVGIGAAFGLHAARRARSRSYRIVAWVGGVNVAARPVQPAARRAARRRPHRARRALGPPRQPLPGDARGRPRRPGHRLGRSAGSALADARRDQPERHLPRPHRAVHRHERPRRDRPRRRRRAPRRRHRRPADVVRHRRGRHATWTPTR